MKFTELQPINEFVLNGMPTILSFIDNTIKTFKENNDKNLLTKNLMLLREVIKTGNFSYAINKHLLECNVIINEISSGELETDEDILSELDNYVEDIKKIKL